MALIKDVTTIGKVLTVIISMFNMNSFQETSLKNYVKLNQMEWIERKKDESEIQAYILNKANEIMKE